MLVMAYLEPRAAPAVEDRAAAWPGRSGGRRRGRPAPRPHPRRDRRSIPTWPPGSRPTRIFHDIRLEPYLVATAGGHPDRADGAAAAGARSRPRPGAALVHGDVSPKNILVGPAGPVFLDAECAWYGDPAFDLAFCLNHLLLKCLWTPRRAAGVPRLLRCPGGHLSGRRPLGARRPRSRRGPRGCCPACCWRGSTASRRSSI